MGEGRRPQTKGTEMEARMNHPAMVVPGAMQALLALGRTIEGAGVSKQLLDAVKKTALPAVFSQGVKLAW